MFRSPLGVCSAIIEYQVRQTVRGAQIAVRCQGHLDFRRLESEIAAKLASAGLPAAEVTVGAVDHCPARTPAS